MNVKTIVGILIAVSCGILLIAHMLGKTRTKSKKVGGGLIAGIVLGLIIAGVFN
jgi:hypothetical protein